MSRKRLRKLPPLQQGRVCRHEWRSTKPHDYCPICRREQTGHWTAPLGTPELNKVWDAIRNGKLNPDAWPEVRAAIVDTASQHDYPRPSAYAARLLGLAFFLCRGVPGIAGTPLVVSEHTGRVARAKAARRRRYRHD